MSTTKNIPKKMPWVIPSNCEGCGGCVDNCKRGCLQMVKTNIDGIYVPWIYEPEKCTGCGKCARACSMGAVVMTSYAKEAANRFIEKKPHIII